MEVGSNRECAPSLKRINRERDSCGPRVPLVSRFLSRLYHIDLPTYNLNNQGERDGGTQFCPAKRDARTRA